MTPQVDPQSAGSSDSHAKESRQRANRYSAHAASVSVVVPTWQRASSLLRCLRSVVAQNPPPKEVIVVGRPEDGPAERVTQEVARGASVRVRWETVDRPGHVAPVKCGLIAAQGEIVVFIDDDAEPESGWIAALLEPFVDSRVACVGGRVRTEGFRGRIQRDAGRIRWYGKHVGNVGALDAPEVVDVDGVMEGNWAWRLSVLRRLRFDSLLDFHDAPMYGLDVCLQARKDGFRIVYQPKASVRHYPAPRDPLLDRNDLMARTRAYSRNYTLVALKHFRGSRWAAFLLWWWMVGERGSYGLLKAAWDLVARGPGMLPLVRASFEGKAQGWRAWQRR